MNTASQVIDYVQELVNRGVLTKRNDVAKDSFVLLSQLTGQGLVIHFQRMEQIEPKIGNCFLDKKSGDKIGVYQILAVFDGWEVWEMTA